jgi:hypothetical protein
MAELLHRFAENGLAKIGTVENANKFLREKYIQVFNTKFSVVAAEKARRFGGPRGPT